MKIFGCFRLVFKALVAGIPATICCLSCGGNTQNNSGASITDVISVGYTNNGTHSVAIAWLNQRPIPLTDGTTNAAAFSGLASGTDVYIVGCQQNSKNVSVACYWKNYLAYPLTDGTTDAVAEAIYINNNDVYIAGYRNTESGSNVITYWKNGTPINLTDPLEINTGEARSIAVSGNDVYVVGWSIEKFEISPSKIVYSPVAKFWKNGIESKLSKPGLEEGVATGIIIDNNDVYISGYTAPLNDHPNPYTAVYWKNGIIHKLTDGIHGGKAFTISKKDTHIVVGGFINFGSVNLATLWDDGKPEFFSDGSANSSIYSICYYQNDQYTSGVGGNFSKQWKNSIPTLLSDGQYQSEAFGVMVVRRP